MDGLVSEGFMQFYQVEIFRMCCRCTQIKLFVTGYYFRGSTHHTKFRIKAHVVVSEESKILGQKIYEGSFCHSGMVGGFC